MVIDCEHLLLNNYKHAHIRTHVHTHVHIHAHTCTPHTHFTELTTRGWERQSPGGSSPAPTPGKTTSLIADWDVDLIVAGGAVDCAGRLTEPARGKWMECNDGRYTLKQGPTF